MKRLLILACIINVNHSFCQTNQKFDRIFQLSLAPGISTNGMHAGGYNNFFSLNITSGYSNANHLIEVAGISNLNVSETRGLQLAGIANITGANAYQGMLDKQIEKKEKEGFEANLSGLQISGLCNKVLDHVYGGQITGGLNIGRGALQGVQLAGVGNTINKYSFGVQVAALWNVSIESMDGFQLSGLINATEGPLYGVQISAFNKAGNIEGINTYDYKGQTALQIGLVNQSRIMNGYQIGLINIGKRMQGTQVGLINIFKNGKTPETRDGTSIGLINIGSSGYVSVYTSELFTTNYEIATGTLKNRRITIDRYEKQIQNALIFSRNIRSFFEAEQWAVGYGLKKMYFNRSTSPGFSKLKFFSFGLDLLHINHKAGKFTHELSLLTRPQITVGSRIHPKNKVFHFFASVNYNFYQSKDDRGMNTIINKEKLNDVNTKKQWPGFAVGVMIQ